MEKIIIDDGTREYAIENKRGEEIGRLVFRPGDVGILNRLQEKYQKLLEELKNISTIDLKSDGTIDTPDDSDDMIYDSDNEEKQINEKELEEMIRVKEQTEKSLKEDINYIFDADVYDSFFSKMSPFSSVNGEFFVTVALEAVAKIIGGTIAQKKKKTKKNVLNQTKGYTK